MSTPRGVGAEYHVPANQEDDDYLGGSTESVVVTTHVEDGKAMESADPPKGDKKSSKVAPAVIDSGTSAPGFQQNGFSIEDCAPEIKDVLRTLDFQGDGFIAVEDLEHAAELIKSHHSDVLTIASFPKSIQPLIAKFDQDGEGEIDARDLAEAARLLEKTREDNKTLKKWVWGGIVGFIFTMLSIFCLVLAVVEMSKETRMAPGSSEMRTKTNNALVVTAVPVMYSTLTDLVSLPLAVINAMEEITFTTVDGVVHTYKKSGASFSKDKGALILYLEGNGGHKLHVNASMAEYEEANLRRTQVLLPNTASGRRLLEESNLDADVGICHENGACLYTLEQMQTLHDGFYAASTSSRSLLTTDDSAVGYATVSGQDGVALMSGKKAFDIADDIAKSMGAYTYGAPFTKFTLDATFKDWCGNYRDLNKCDLPAPTGRHSARIYAPYKGVEASSDGLWYFNDAFVYEKDKDSMKVTIQYSHDRKDRKHVIMLSSDGTQYLHYDEVDVVDDDGTTTKKKMRCSNKEPESVPGLDMGRRLLQVETRRYLTDAEHRFHAHIRRSLHGFGHVHVSFPNHPEPHFNRVGLRGFRRLLSEGEEDADEEEVSFESPTVTNGPIFSRMLGSELGNCAELCDTNSTMPDVQNEDCETKCNNTYYTQKVEMNVTSEYPDDYMMTASNLPANDVTYGNDTIEWPQIGSCYDASEVPGFEDKIVPRNWLQGSLDQHGNTISSSTPSSSGRRLLEDEDEMGTSYEEQVLYNLKSPSYQASRDSNQRDHHKTEAGRAHAKRFRDALQTFKEYSLKSEKSKEKKKKWKEQRTAAIMKSRTLRNKINAVQSFSVENDDESVSRDEGTEIPDNSNVLISPQQRKLLAEKQLTDAQYIKKDLKTKAVAEITGFIQYVKCGNYDFETEMEKLISKESFLDDAGVSMRVRKNRCRNARCQCFDLAVQAEKLGNAFQSLYAIITDEREVAEEIRSIVNIVSDAADDVGDVLLGQTALNLAASLLGGLPYVGGAIKLVNMASKLLKKGITSPAKKLLDKLDTMIDKTKLDNVLCNFTTFMNFHVEVFKPLDNYFGYAAHMLTQYSIDCPQQRITRDVCNVANTAYLVFAKVFEKYLNVHQNIVSWFEDLWSVFDFIDKVDSAWPKKFFENLGDIMDPFVTLLDRPITVKIKLPVPSVVKTCFTPIYPCGNSGWKKFKTRWCNMKQVCTWVPKVTMTWFEWTFTVGDIINTITGLIDVVVNLLEEMVKTVMKALGLNIDLSSLIPGFVEPPNVFGFVSNIDASFLDLPELPDLPQVLPDFSLATSSPMTCVSVEPVMQKVISALRP